MSSPQPERNPLVVDVWADVLCPWCYLGKRRLEAAVAAYERPHDVTIIHHAFELDPTTPAGTKEPMLARLQRKYGRSEQEAREMAERVAVLARPDGLAIDIDTSLTANTFDAHRLVALALAQGGPALQGAVMERLYAAAHEEGRAVDDHGVLQRLTAEAGLDEVLVAKVLADDEYADQVREDEALAQQIGVTGVPFTVAGPPDGPKVAVSGAQPVEGFLELLHAGASGDAG